MKNVDHKNIQIYKRTNIHKTRTNTKRTTGGKLGVKKDWVIWDELIRVCEVGGYKDKVT